jgi:hypothetical protein
MPRPLETQLSHFDPGRPGKERNMVYLIQVGNYSRRQTFIKLYEKAAVIDDKYTQYDIDKYFQDKYEGFSVIVTQIKEVEPVKDIRHQVNDDEWERQSQKSPERISALKYFKIKYTDEEKKLHDDWEKSVRKAEKALRDLHTAIEKRYLALFYSDVDNRNSFELDTDFYGTRCEKFPVKADLFIEAAKGCDGAVPEKSVLSETTEFPEIDTVEKAEIEVPSFDDDLKPEISDSVYASDDVPF